MNAQIITPEIFCESTGNLIGHGVYYYTCTDDQLKNAREKAGPLPNGGTDDNCRAWLERLCDALEDFGAVQVEVISHHFHVGRQANEN